MRVWQRDREPWGSLSESMAHVVEHIIDTVGSDVVLMCGAKVGVEPRKLEHGGLRRDW